MKIRLIVFIFAFLCIQPAISAESVQGGKLCLDNICIGDTLESLSRTSLLDRDAIYEVELDHGRKISIPDIDYKYRGNFDSDKRLMYHLSQGIFNKSVLKSLQKVEYACMANRQTNLGYIPGLLSGQIRTPLDEGSLMYIYIRLVPDPENATRNSWRVVKIRKKYSDRIDKVTFKKAVMEKYAEFNPIDHQESNSLVIMDEYFNELTLQDPWSKSNPINCEKPFSLD